MFITTPISIFINPCFIARDGIYRNILRNADAISGKVLDIGCGSKPYEQLFRNVESYIGVYVEISGHDHVNSKVDFFMMEKHYLSVMKNLTMSFVLKS